jgi:hypothetical protein
MRVNLRLATRDGGVEDETERLRRIYGSFEELQQGVRAQGCSVPHAVDDLEVWKALRSGEATVETWMTYQSAAIFADLTPRRLELLHRLSARAYPTIRSLADDCGRDYKNVYDDLAALRRWGLVDLLRRGRGVTPTSRVAEIRVVLD